MLEIFPTGEFEIKKIDKYGIHFQFESSLICIPRSLIALNSCMKCKHFNFKNKDANTCKAFPGGIPNIIFLGKNDHKELFPGDHGIQFEPLEEKETNEE